MRSIQFIFLILVEVVFRTFIDCDLIQPTSCPSGWREYENKCYHFNRITATFNETISYCELFNSKPVSIHSKEEHDFVSNLIFDKFNEAETWLGAIYLAYGSYDYKWVDESKFNYTNWNLHQPDCSSSDCCSIELDKYGWNAIPCSFYRQKLCQITLVSNSTTVKSTGKGNVTTADEERLELYSELQYIQRGIRNLTTWSNRHYAKTMDLSVSIEDNFIDVINKLNGLVQRVATEARDERIMFSNVSNFIQSQLIKSTEISANIQALANSCKAKVVKSPPKKVFTVTDDQVIRLIRNMTIRRDELDVIQSSSQADILGQLTFLINMVRETKKSLNEVLFTKKASGTRLVQKDHHDTSSALLYILIMFELCLSVLLILGFGMIYIKLTQLTTDLKVKSNNLEMDLKPQS